MSSDDIAISVRHLTKTYRIFGHPGERLKQAISLGLRKYHRDFTALKDVSFDVKKGETLGIIGRNGSGKSTLLQLICGILKPTAGTMQVNGRVSALLELGAGFNPEFTGRENVYFQGALIGLSREEMDRRFDDIAAFADIGEFIDHPIRMYSSGMFVRLGFAVAVGIDPDILIVDEALAVGDVRFQSRCFRRFEQLKDRGVTVLVVSHATEQITRLCDHAILLETGRLVAFGSPGMVTDQYLTLLFDTASPQTGLRNSNTTDNDNDFYSHDTRERFHQRPAYNPNEYRWGNRTALILDFHLKGSQALHLAQINWTDERVEVRTKVLFLQEVSRPVFGLTVKTKDGITVFGINSMGNDELSARRDAGTLVILQFAITPHFLPGDYFISLGVVDGSSGETVPLDRRYDSIHLRVTGATAQFGLVNLDPEIRIVDTYQQPTSHPPPGTSMTV